jgi:hypothetical protein
LELDVAVDAMKIVERNKAMGCSDIPNTAEVLPGQVICADNIIRRETTAEAKGYDTFKAQNPVKMLVGVGDGRTYNAEENQWETKEKKQRQSTPEELSAWLNDMPKRSFKTRVEVDGDDKLLIAEDAEGILYAFRYLEGLPGTYIGGDETRPLDPPQLTVGKNSPSRVVQYFDRGNACTHIAVEPKEYADEFVSRYVPTSHFERLTVGGTALFDELREAIALDKATAEPEIKLAQPQVCEWYPDGETRCTYAPTHAATKTNGAVCDRCYAAREARA